MTRRNGSSPPAGFALALGAVAFVIVLATLLPEPKEEVSGAVGTLVDTPLPGGITMPLEEALRVATTPLYRASTPLASDESISEVWVRGGESPEVLIFYETGVATTIEPDSIGFSLQEYAQSQSRDGVPGGIKQIGGIEAFVVDPGDGEQGASVKLIIDGTIVTLLAGKPAIDISADDLEAVAASVVERSGQIAAEKAAV